MKSLILFLLSGVIASSAHADLAYIPHEDKETVADKLEHLMSVNDYGIWFLAFLLFCFLVFLTVYFYKRVKKKK